MAAMDLGKVTVTTSMDDMMYFLHRGPTSCMSHPPRNYNSSVHPYTCYDPKYGWGLAVRLDEAGSVAARALVLHDSAGEPLCWVRSFGKDSGGFTHSDPLLEGWMTEQGYQHKTGWPDGTKLLRIDDGMFDSYENEAPYVAPYVDGNNDYASVMADCLVIGCCEGGVVVDLDYTGGFAHSRDGDDDDDDDYDDYDDDDDDDYDDDDDDDDDGF